MAFESSGNLNDVFPHKVCINLDRRPDCWERMQARFVRHDIRDVRRVSAVDGGRLTIPASWSDSAGAYGCLHSHLQVVREARRLGLPSLLIFEDDVVFNPRFQQRLAASLKALPPDWDMLYLGALHIDDPLPVSNAFVRIRQSLSTYAYAVKRTVFDAFVALNDSRAKPVDVNNLALQTLCNAYCYMPHLAWVDTSYSEIQQTVRNHWYLKESLVLHGRGMKQLLSQTTMVIAFHNPEACPRAVRDVLSIVNYYCEQLPGISILIVEQARSPTVDSARLPAGCHYVLLSRKGALHRGECLRVGLGVSGLPRKIVMFCDSGIFLETQDVRGNLRMCERYEATTGFRNIVDVTWDDASPPPATDSMRSFKPANTDLRTESSGHRYCCFLNDKALRMLAECDDWWSDPEGPLAALQTRQRIRLFESPNHALRLSHRGSRPSKSPKSAPIKRAGN